jgi:DNA end-binding protein Ku
MASSVWTGSIILSLISIPVRLYAAARSKRTYLHQIHKVCNTRLRQPLFCPTCNRIVNRDEVVKGYEFDEGQYVLIEDKEIKKLAAESSHSLEILTFTKLKEIDPIFFDSSYFCMPEDVGKKPYRLLVKALEATQAVGIGKLLMHQRDYTVFLRTYEHGLVLHTMYFANEIRKLPEFGAATNAETKPQELKLTEQLITTLMEPFNPKQYHDEFQEKLQHLIDAKLHGKKTSVEAEPAAKRAPVIDMMAALKKSLAASGAAAPEKRRGRLKSARTSPVRKAG